jgi:hypothetical protein
MPTTSNFGWTTPADTDLVKDGAAAIRTLGNGIDTSLVDLKGGTTGQILSKASNTDLDYTWIANDQGDITEVQAGVGISIASGTGPIPVITNSSTDLITTAGDILYGTAADTVARLGIGTAGQVLTVNSGATAPEWKAPAPAESMTLISTTALSGASITLTSIPSTYKNLVIVLRDFELAASTGGHLLYQLNADTTANAHRQISQSGQATTSTTASATGTSFTTVDDIVGFNPNSNYSQITIFDYANAITRKAVDIINGYGGNTGNIYTQRITGTFTVTTAISSVKIALGAGTFSAGNALLYGVS